ncbi:unnamed protein product [Owenia fusiformis]|uniref:Uncharacterized protein n=1 Tax=Owenia fusiformis TaxID=6347 RepID=A0A8S4NDY0_OWEFU|nr:unnamed protein product [Owenia fusiformis]
MWNTCVSCMEHCINKDVCGVDIDGTMGLTAPTIFHGKPHMHSTGPETVIPYLVDQSGNSISANDKSRLRRSRSIHQEHSESHNKLYFKIQTKDHNFHLSLEKNTNLLHRNFKVHRRKSLNGPLEMPTEIKFQHCFYHGSVLSHEESSVAINVCNGLRGHIRTPLGDFFIEPSHNHPNISIHQRKQHHPPDGSKESNFPHEIPHTFYRKPNLPINFSGSNVNKDSSSIVDTAFKYAESLGSRTIPQSHNRLKRSIGVQENFIVKSPTLKFPKNSNNKNAIRNNKIENYENKTNSNGHRKTNNVSTGNNKTIKHHSGTTPHDKETNEIDQGRESNNMDTTSDSQQNFRPDEVDEAANHGWDGAYDKDDNDILNEHTKSEKISVTTETKGHANKHHHSAEGHEVGHTMEMMVVLDKYMVEYHGRENVAMYALTILNMVSDLFQDNTIGTKVNIVIVSLLILEEDEPGLEISHHGQNTLYSFCSWQSNILNKDGKAHHDHAILLTRKDICSYSEEPCDTLGFAPMKGMCKRHQSCTVNEDSGLGTALTITHELGHNFGMVHDGQQNSCKKTQGSIMAPVLGGINGQFLWSPCSRMYMQNFFKSNQSRCLNNVPQEVPLELQFPDKLPGELYDSDRQCKWQFGEESRLCIFSWGKDVCTHLWCHSGGLKCETKFLPAAEGTSCGHARWCRKGKCVRFGSEGPKPIDGDWSDYGAYTPCTRTCGGGITYKERMCNQPKPQYGGKFCEGESREYKICNIQECPAESSDFRAYQCAQYNSEKFRGYLYNWKPYTDIFDEDDFCRLYCKAEGYDFYFALSNKVVDGTRCQQGSSNVCVDGLCMEVGCDNVVKSKAVIDRCGVCGGNGTDCDIINGTFTDQPKQYDYHEIVKIPKGARSLKISETKISPNYLAIKNDHGAYYLTGHWRVTWPGKFMFAGAKFEYKRPHKQPEMIKSPGPIDEQLIVEVLMQGYNPGIYYEYTMPKINAMTVDLPHNYTWSAVTSQCSVTCAGGTQVTSAKCLRDYADEMEDKFCAKKDKPITGLFPCNEQPCPARWVTQAWQQCSRSCGGGKQKRRVYCMQQVSPTQDFKVKPKFCQQIKPPRKQDCNEHECPPEWHISHWSQCSASCGSGKKKRDVVCRSVGVNGVTSLTDNMCLYIPKPVTTQSCYLGKCPKLQWLLSSWSKCSTTCGPGVRKRKLMCSNMDSGGVVSVATAQCYNLPKPNIALVEQCTISKQCYRARWYVTAWNKCSVTCGTGVETRVVKCMNNDQNNAVCKDRKPDSERKCKPKPCKEQGNSVLNTVADIPCSDYYKWCYLVPKHKLCSHKFYGAKCCSSCLKVDAEHTVAHRRRHGH